jgi:hypothetical protein
MGTEGREGRDATIHAASGWFAKPAYVEAKAGRYDRIHGD